MGKKKIREAGVLMPVASLPSKYGIGCFSKEAYEFVDMLSAAGQRFWQILPLGPTGYGDSPYQSFSTFAGNPYFIDPEYLIERGWITKKKCDSFDFGNNEQYIDYEKIYKSRFKLLRIAYEKSNIGQDKEFKAFVKANSDWLPDYALYMAIKDSKKSVAWTQWDEDIKLRKKSALTKYTKELAEDIEFYQFMQYLFAAQWMALKNYANEKGIKIIGDIPIYVAFDSADAWANPQLFQFDKDLKPVAVAGCPPDCFCATGQLWGNPLYDWPYHKKTEYKWWLRRLEYVFSLYDVVRIDHFRGFDEYYSIPYGDPTAEFGHWEPGPGYELFAAMKEKLGEKDVIAEDLGFLTPSVVRLVKKTGYPGMKILLFAFDKNMDSDYLSYRYIENSIVYTGTHDNDTVRGWADIAGKDDLGFAREYLNLPARGYKDKLADAMIRDALASVSYRVIIPIQDYLNLGNEARINMPSTLGDNWKWRMTPGQLTMEKCEYIAKLMKVYGRNK